MNERDERDEPIDFGHGQTLRFSGWWPVAVPDPDSLRGPSAWQTWRLSLLTEQRLAQQSVGENINIGPMT